MGYNARECLPHARGGVSQCRIKYARLAVSSPRSWGCFPSALRLIITGEVFPTLVGVFPGVQKKACSRFCLPHARGGVSETAAVFASAPRSSPRSWGCFSANQCPQGLEDVFPTLVGVFLSRVIWCCPASRLPHARGGVSSLLARCKRPPSSSPRSWGCFPRLPFLPVHVHVFPTLVGVFLPRPSAEDL